jgi:hypothetical protein
VHRWLGCFRSFLRTRASGIINLQKEQGENTQSNQKTLADKLHLTSPPFFYYFIFQKFKKYLNASGFHENILGDFDAQRHDDYLVFSRTEIGCLLFSSDSSITRSEKK